MGLLRHYTSRNDEYSLIMRILVVSSFLPYPLFSGGHVRLYNLIKELSKNHKITLICEKRDYQTERDIKEVEKLCEQVVTVPRKKQWTFENILKSGFSRFPFLLVGHKSLEMKNHIVRVLNEKTYDLIHVETFYVYQNVPRTYLPKILIEHNIEYQVYQKYENISATYLKPLLKADIQKIKYWEEKTWKQASRVVAVSEFERKQIEKIVSNVAIVANGVDVQKYKMQNAKLKFNKKEKRILFIGDFKWIQNQKAAEWILREIWPLIDSRLKTTKGPFGINDSRIKLWIVGRNIPERLKNLGSENVIFDENAPAETEKIYQKATMLLAPITVGGGTSYKILESMASGLPVVTTHLGIEGLGAKPGVHALIGNTSEELADCVDTLIKEEKEFETIALNARKLIEQKYTWTTIAKELENVYKSVVKSE
jgi:glycosyltransferase involved in cell wall biosynthesis